MNINDAICVQTVNDCDAVSCDGDDAVLLPFDYSPFQSRQAQQQPRSAQQQPRSAQQLHQVPPRMDSMH